MVGSVEMNLSIAQIKHNKVTKYTKTFILECTCGTLLLFVVLLFIYEDKI